MKTTVNSQAQFISYRSDLVTKAFGKHFMIAFATMGIVALTQLSSPGVITLDDQASISSLEVQEESKDSQANILTEPLNDFK